MSFSEALQRVIKNYANFSGRSRRSEYWYLALLNVLVMLLATVPDLVNIVWVYVLLAIIPTLACMVRRLHDTGRGGLYLLLILALPVGPILLIYWLATDSQPGNNQFGPNPKRYTPGHVPPPPPSGRLYVQCLSGPLQGQIYPVNRKIVFGRSNSCAVRMPDGTPGISVTHCALRIGKGGGAMLEDLNSKYGTFLADGRRLPPNYPEPIAPGTRFYLATPQLMFRLVMK